MRLNQFIAQHTDLSRRGADQAVAEGRVKVNGIRPSAGYRVSDGDRVTLDDREITPSAVPITTIMLNKPEGYVCSRKGQGSKTIYELLPGNLQHLNPVGRLDKQSSGLLLITNDGRLANQLTHPRFGKIKRYQVGLSAPLAPLHQQMISDIGISLEDGISKLGLQRIDDSRKQWTVEMSEGRNRQIRRTFAALGYDVCQLHRTDFGGYALGDLKPGLCREVRLVN